MAKKTAPQKISYYYLCSVPVLTIVFAFVTGHISYAIYLPVWLLNIGLMIGAVKMLGANLFKNKYIYGSACLLTGTAALLSILFGMGAPPGSIQEWVSTATEQKARFDVLLAAGILIALGFAVLKLALQERGEKLYAQLGYTAIVLAIPLFFINTSFWHSYAQKAYSLKLTEGANSVHGWFSAGVQQTWIITMGEVLLTYFAVAMFALSLKATGIFKRLPAVIYVVVSGIAIVSILLFPVLPGATAFDGFPYYPFMIPAIPIFICYYIGVNLIAK